MHTQHKHNTRTSRQTFILRRRRRLQHSNSRPRTNTHICIGKNTIILSTHTLSLHSYTVLSSHVHKTTLHLHLFICVSICHTVRFKVFFSVVLQVSNTSQNSLDYVKISQETREIQCREGKLHSKSNKANLGRSRWLLMDSYQQLLPAKQIKMWKLDSNI